MVGALSSHTGTPNLLGRNPESKPNKTGISVVGLRLCRRNSFLQFAVTSVKEDSSRWVPSILRPVDYMYKGPSHFLCVFLSIFL
jgi:hypothetical protein